MFFGNHSTTPSPAPTTPTTANCISDNVLPTAENCADRCTTLIQEGVCYAQNLEGLNWAPAKQHCETSGGRLATAETESIHDGLVSAGLRGWLGLRENDNKWFWLMDGDAEEEAVDPAPQWDESQPTGSGPYAFLGLDSGKLQDLSGTDGSKRKSICQYKLPISSTVETGSTAPICLPDRYPTKDTCPQLCRHTFVDGVCFATVGDAPWLNPVEAKEACDFGGGRLGAAPSDPALQKLADAGLVGWTALVREANGTWMWDTAGGLVPHAGDLDQWWEVDMKADSGTANLNNGKTLGHFPVGSNRTRAALCMYPDAPTSTAEPSTMATTSPSCLPYTTAPTAANCELLCLHVVQEDRCFARHNTGGNYSQGLSLCSEGGGQLAVVSSDAALAALAGLGGGGGWVGLRQTSTGVWAWQLPGGGERVLQIDSNWWQDTPDASGTLLVGAFQVPTARLFGFIETGPRASICMFPMETSTNFTSTTTVASSTSAPAETTTPGCLTAEPTAENCERLCSHVVVGARCYARTLTPKTPAGGRSLCQNGGGHLAVAFTSTTLHAVSELGAGWISLMMVEGKWSWTLPDESLRTATTEVDGWWAADHPKNGTSRVLIHADGKLRSRESAQDNIAICMFTLPSISSESCHYTRHAYRGLINNPSATELAFQAGSLAACLAFCDARPACPGVNFRDWDGRCALKNGTAMAPLTNHNRVEAYSKNHSACSASVTQSEQGCNYRQYRQLGNNENSLIGQDQNSPSKAACASLCDREADCVAAVYIPASTRCYMKSSLDFVDVHPLTDFPEKSFLEKVDQGCPGTTTAGPTTTLDLTTSTAHPSPVSSEGCFYTRHPNKALEGFNDGDRVHNVSLAVCLSLCDGRGTCPGVIYRDGACGLKNHTAMAPLANISLWDAYERDDRNCAPPTLQSAQGCEYREYQQLGIYQQYDLVIVVNATSKAACASLCDSTAGCVAGVYIAALSRCATKRSLDSTAVRSGSHVRILMEKVDPSCQTTTTANPTTTLAPTTQAPTTQAPTTQAPTTHAPTTQAPTTQAPTTQAPTTQAPTTQAPTTQAPTTQAPTTQAPTTQAPTTQAPTTLSPTMTTKTSTHNCAYTHHPGKTVATAGVYNVTTDGYTACISLCDAAGCSGVVYTAAQNHCSVRRNGVVPPVITDSATSDYYDRMDPACIIARMNSSLGCPYDVYSGIETEGTVIETAVGRSEEECADLCDRDPRCKIVEFGDDTCFLQNTTRSVSVRSDRVAMWRASADCGPVETTTLSTANLTTSSTESLLTTMFEKTTTMHQDTTSTVPDTTSTFPDTTSTFPDATSTFPDTTSTFPDTTSTLPDTTSTFPDTTSTFPDTTSTFPDTQSTFPDTTSKEQSTTAWNKPDTSSSGFVTPTAAKTDDTASSDVATATRESSTTPGLATELDATTRESLAAKTSSIQETTTLSQTRSSSASVILQTITGHALTTTPLSESTGGIQTSEESASTVEAIPVKSQTLPQSTHDPSSSTTWTIAADSVTWASSAQPTQSTSTESTSTSAQSSTAASESSSTATPTVKSTTHQLRTTTKATSTYESASTKGDKISSTTELAEDKSAQASTAFELPDAKKTTTIAERTSTVPSEAQPTTEESTAKTDQDSLKTTQLVTNEDAITTTANGDAGTTESTTTTERSATTSEPATTTLPGIATTKDPTTTTPAPAKASTAKPTSTETPTTTTAFPFRQCRTALNVRYSGGQVISNASSSVEECCRRCQTEPKCQSFTYDVANRTCFLLGSLGKRSLEKGWLSGGTPDSPMFRGTGEAGDGGGKCLTEEHMTSYYGGDMGRKSNVSQGDCCELCFETPGCVGYSFERRDNGTGNGHCTLKRPTRQRNPVFGQSFISATMTTKRNVSTTAAPTTTERPSTEPPATKAPRPRDAPPEPLPPVMDETEQVVADTIQSIGCIWIVVAAALTLAVCALFRNTSHERLIHVSQELSILLAHVIILAHRDPKFSDYNWTLCRVSALALHYLQTVTTAAFLLEAVQIYAVSTSVEMTGGYFTRRASFVLAWGLPAVLTGLTAPFIYYDYVSWFSCWINLDAIGSKVVFGPIIILVAITVITWEAASSFRGQVLATDPTQKLTALVNRQGLPVVMGLYVACHATGSMAIHYQRVGIYGLVFVLNAVFGSCLFFFHALSDQRIRAAFARILPCLKTG